MVVRTPCLEQHPNVEAPGPGMARSNLGLLHKHVSRMTLSKAVQNVHAPTASRQCRKASSTELATYVSCVRGPIFPAQSRIPRSTMRNGTSASIHRVIWNHSDGVMNAMSLSVCPRRSHQACQTRRAY